MDVLVKKATTCMPLFRDELLSDVVCKKAYGNVSHVWHFPGHILLCTNNGQKLFTFDCVPVSLQQAFDQKFLDIPNLPSPVLDCHMLSGDILALIDKQGHVRLWKFSENCVWIAWGDLDLCQSNSAEVTSVGYVRSTRQFVWCEKRQSPASSSASLSSSSSSQAGSFCVCRKQLPATFNLAKVSSFGPSSILMHNVPDCNISAITQEALFISLKYDKHKVSLHMIFNFADDSMGLYVGDKFVTSAIGDGIDFQEVALTCLSSITKIEPGHGDCGVRADESEGHAAVLNSSGVVEVFAFSLGSEKKCFCKRNVQLKKCDIELASAEGILWFLHQQLLGIMVGNTLSIYSLKDGDKVCELGLDESINSLKFVPSKSPVFQAWLLTADQLYGLQARDISAKEIFTTPDKLPDDQLLQTDILKLARLQEQKSEGYSLAVSQELEKLKEKWHSLGGSHQQSEVAQILAPYVEEYWRLDNLSKAFLDSEKQRLFRIGSRNSPEALVAALMDARTISRSARHSKLLWLSQIYPQQVLDYLLQGISFQDSVDQNQLRQWQSLIGLDGGDLLNFEFVCRLLFYLEPAKLLQFVKCAECVSEQAVGVSAFIRKKHSMIYYKAACECLPECQTSTDPMVAAASKAKLIQASESDNCEEQALKCYLQHGLWTQAIELLREVERLEKAKAGTKGSKHADRGGLLPPLLHVTVTALAQNQVLSDYVTDLLSLMPNWKSFLSFSKVATGWTEFRQQQLSTSVQDVFVTGEQNSVPLECVKSNLVDLLSRLDTK